MITHFVIEKIQITAPKATRSKRLRKQFRLAVIEMLRRGGFSKKEAKAEIKGLQIHHVVPLSFGGEESMDNMVLVERWLHKRIHLFMQNSIDYGAMWVLIPKAPNGEKIWREPKRKARIPTYYLDYFFCHI